MSGHKSELGNGNPTSSLEHLYLRFALLNTDMSPPAELAIPSTAADDGFVTEGYQGKNMTLPASWWTSTSLFNLERRAIFAKVTPSTLQKERG